MGRLSVQSNGIGESSVWLDGDGWFVCLVWCDHDEVKSKRCVYTHT